MNYKLNDGKMFADITDDIAIIINSETGIYYGMNSFATNVYENIVNGASVEKVLEAVKALEGAPSTIGENYKMFIDAMADKEILIPAETSDAEVSLNIDFAREDEFALNLKEYNDAQELLLADPIHEVKEEIGWTPEKDSIGYTKEETREREKKMEE